MSDLRKAAQDVVDTWKIYGTAESLRGWMDILEAALAQGCYIAQDMTRQEYERLYPDAEEEVK